MRLFMIFHDCCHNSFFKVTEDEHNNGIRGLNKIVANILEPVVMYDEYTWRKSHGHHHAVHGNMNENDSSKLVITISEYNNLSIINKIIYRFYRCPLFFFPFFAPMYVFFIQHIYKPLFMIKRICFFYLIIIVGGNKLIKRIFIGQILFGIIGVMLFHLQHHVNQGYWKHYEKKDTLSYDRAQLHGASMLCIPKFLKWATFGIEYHHIHHLTPRIPSYNLKKCHEINKHLFNKITKVGYIQAFKSLFHTLYDEKKERYVSFNFAKFLGLEY